MWEAHPRTADGTSPVFSLLGTPMPPWGWPDSSRRRACNICAGASPVHRLDDLMVPRFCWFDLRLAESLYSMKGLPVSTCASW